MRYKDLLKHSGSTLPIGLATFCVTLLLLGQSTQAANHRVGHVGDYILTKNGEIGTIAINPQITKNRIVISFKNKEKRTEIARSFPPTQVFPSLPSIQISNKRLKVGDYVSVKLRTLEEKSISTSSVYTLRNLAFLQIEALFEDQILLKRVEDKYNKRYSPSSSFLFRYEDIESIIATKDLLTEVSTEIKPRVLKDFENSLSNISTSLNCLENNLCDFDIQVSGFRKLENEKFSLFLGSSTTERNLERVRIKSKNQYLEYLKRQALQYKLYTGLANAWQMNVLHKTQPYIKSIALSPLPGVRPLHFRMDSTYPESIQKIITEDINGWRFFNKGIMLMAGISPLDSSDIFGDSEACNSSGCYKNNNFKDMIQPLYRMLIKEMIQSQSYLPFLSWKLDERDFVVALKKAQSEIQHAQQMIHLLKQEQQTFLLSFFSTFEKVISSFSTEKQELTRSLLEAEENNKTFWKDLIAEIKKPQFWGVMGCYTISITTPVKFMHLICHTAGLSLTGYNLFTNIQKTRSLYNMQQMQMIPLELFSQAAYSLAIESVLSIFYIRSSTPDFRSALKNRKNLTTSLSTQVGSGSLRALNNNLGVKHSLSHASQTLQNKLSALMYSAPTASPALMSQFLSNKQMAQLTYDRPQDLFMSDFLSIGLLFSIAMEQPFMENINACINLKKAINPDEHFTDEELKIIDSTPELQKRVQAMQDVYIKSQNILNEHCVFPRSAEEIGHDNSMTLQSFLNSNSR